MVLTLLVLLGAAVPQETVDISRRFTVGEKSRYEVKSRLLSEVRLLQLNTFMPAEFGFEYRFTTEVTGLRGDGDAVLIYERPSVTEIIGETAEEPEQRKVEKLGWKLRLTLSTINEILSTEDLAPPAPQKAKWASAAESARPGQEQPNPLARYITEIRRLCLFVGPFDSALDFNPKLPFDEVKVGETWKRTVGYTPQPLAGKPGRSAVQKLDLTYRYAGVVEVGGRKVHRVTAETKLDTDAAEFVNQMLGMSAEESGLKEFRLQLETEIAFDLDLATRRTLKAVAKSRGAIRVQATVTPRPVYEERLTGETTMTLLDR